MTPKPRAGAKQNLQDELDRVFLGFELGDLLIMQSYVFQPLI